MPFGAGSAVVTQVSARARAHSGRASSFRCPLCVRCTARDYRLIFTLGRAYAMGMKPSAVSTGNTARSPYSPALPAERYGEGDSTGSDNGAVSYFQFHKAQQTQHRF
jgi:hypothetical protein